MARAQHPDLKHVRADLTASINTTAAAPATTLVDLGLVEVESITVLIPPGHSGLTGVQVRYDGETLLPWKQAAQWFIGDDDERIFHVGFPVAHPVQVRAFNLDDTYPHTFYLTFSSHDQLAKPAGGDALADLTPLRL